MVNKLTLLQPFLTQPKEELHLSAISRELNQPHPTIRLHLNSLVEKGILKKKARGRQTLFSLNKSHPNLIDFLAICEKNKLINLCERELVLKELVDHIHKYEQSIFILFGSAVNNFKTANDLDILVIGKYNKKELKRFSEKFNKEIHIIQSNSLKSISISLKNEIIKKHVIIYRCDQVIKWLYG